MSPASDAWGGECCPQEVEKPCESAHRRRVPIQRRIVVERLLPIALSLFCTFTEVRILRTSSRSASLGEFRLEWLCKAMSSQVVEVMCSQALRACR